MLFTAHSDTVGTHVQHMNRVQISVVAAVQYHCACMLHGQAAQVGTAAVLKYGASTCLQECSEAVVVRAQD
jgi:hypothetical protein